MKNIVLTGFMGTGKTTVGRLLAERLGFGFVDTDELIVWRDGRTIPDIFAQEGEAYFRQLETAVALELAAQSNLVIATGGRLMLDEVNARALERHGRVFCLTATPDAILARVQNEGRRPLLHVPDPAAQIERLLAERREGYGRYPQIETTGKTAETVVEEIKMMIREEREGYEGA
ncbi:MAG: shikimate kinase [Chloroflexi bacterium]|nr:shikimate kinase [Ardenticatenaceae bacterium]MBL1128611.1 shikimate kinase [Chloroflexota bacterium]NOG34690.1 shikimate kinase [Chloroflexota bacterium]GIK57753.1 MAG: shikimate kinase [Chloroflexota bacterium]